MKLKLTIAVLMFLALNSEAQEKSALSDTLVKNKETLLTKYVPMYNGEYLYCNYQLPIDTFINRVNAFKAAFDKEISKEKDPVLRGLKREDVLYYSYDVLGRYQVFYGTDSLGMVALHEALEKKKAEPNFYELVDSLHKLAFRKRLNNAELERIDAIVDESPILDNVALFKTSSAYRQWLSQYLQSIQRKKYPADTTLGYGGENVAMLKVVAATISEPFIKEYLLYTYTGTIIKSLKNKEAKENAYKDFMAVVKNPVYKADIAEVYTNYKNMSANAIAPDFVYNDVDGKQISLKSLRGKYVYIDVWATWCGPCKAEIPFLTKIEHDYSAKNIHFVSLSVDQMKDKAKWVSYVKDNKLEGIQVMADKDFSSDFVKKFNINSIPRFILIDPTGKIVAADAKRPSDPELRKEFDKLLK